jgi:hypothetical protein
MRESCTSGTARGEGGNLLAYSTLAAKGVGGQEHLCDHGLFEPEKEVLHQRCGILAPVRQLGFSG